MKDHFKISYLTKFGAVYVNNNQVMDLETWFQIHTNISNFETVYPQTIQTLKIFVFSVIYLKINKYCYFQLSFFEMVAI